MSWYLTEFSVKLYDLAKVHKKDCPLRPVVSMIGTAHYELAKYMDNIIKPAIPSKFMLNSTNSLIDKLADINLPPNFHMVSFDVVSLFTNIPLDQTIQWAADYVYSSSDHPTYSKEIFCKLLKLATLLATQRHFLFSRKTV